MLIKRVFISRHHHPGKQKGAAPGDDVHLPRIPHEGLHRTAVDAGVDGHKIYALFRVSADDAEEIFGGDLQQILLQIANGVVHGYGADHGGGFGDELPAEGVGFAVIAQVHNGFRAELQGQIHLLHLHIIVVAVPGDAQVDIDFRAESRSDALRGNGCMADVAGNGDFAPGKPAAAGLPAP